MSDLPAEPRSFEDYDPEDLLTALRRQLDAVRSRLEEHRAEMVAAGLAPGAPPAEPDAGR